MNARYTDNSITDANKNPPVKPQIRTLGGLLSNLKKDGCFGGSDDFLGIVLNDVYGIPYEKADLWHDEIETKPYEFPTWTYPNIHFALGDLIHEEFHTSEHLRYCSKAEKQLLKILMSDKSQNLNRGELDRICDLLECRPNGKHTPWAKTLAKHISDWSYKQGFLSFAVAGIIADKSPEASMLKFSKVIDDWGNARELGMTMDDFEKAGYKIKQNITLVRR